VVLSGKNSGDVVAIEVENSGSCIAPEVLAQIFEPFFTTKPGGTGLGLAIARNTVRSQGGELTLSQNGPTVVKFTLTLPMRVKVLAKGTS
jgi:signal transduction histidine kinase